MNKLRKSQGFTLIEILVVIGIIAILASVVIIAINPARQFAQARNTQRTSNVGTILNAIGQNLADNKGVFKCDTLSGVAIDINDKNISDDSGAGDINLSCLTPKYIPTALPFDPSADGAQWTSDSDYNTKYSVKVDSDGRYTICAPTLEPAVGNTIICLTR